ncbi:hypothetical protein F2Q68_00027612 [Brassica cretica]|uniref:Uncharacterized protein n=1 Tax=Brassica cretica TaxID=69181 RepID=A0A8S9ICR5_BRACR|nr:hypothetical protein F2Q68_00027612 [Brassica cretica]
MASSSVACNGPSEQLGSSLNSPPQAWIGYVSKLRTKIKNKCIGSTLDASSSLNTNVFKQCNRLNKTIKFTSLQAQLSKFYYDPTDSLQDT